MARRYFDSVLSTPGAPRVIQALTGCNLIGDYGASRALLVIRLLQKVQVEAGKGLFVVSFPILVEPKSAWNFLGVKFENDLALTTS